MALKIALDFDGTYTASPELWDDFIASALEYGYDVRIVTLRHKKKGPLEDFVWDIPIIFCNGEPKRKVCSDIGWSPNIWIDDMPETISDGSILSVKELKGWWSNGRS